MQGGWEASFVAEDKNFAVELLCEEFDHIFEISIASDQN
jgi:hypothetical protein